MIKDDIIKEHFRVDAYFKDSNNYYYFRYVTYFTFTSLEADAVSMKT